MAIRGLRREGARRRNVAVGLPGLRRLLWRELRPVACACRTPGPALIGEMPTWGSWIRGGHAPLRAQGLGQPGRRVIIWQERWDTLRPIGRRVWGHGGLRGRRLWLWERTRRIRRESGRRLRRFRRLICGDGKRRHLRRLERA